MIRFGTGGNPERFYENGGTSSLEMPEFLRGIGLNAYEYQALRGIKITGEAAEILKQNAEENDIFLSLHAPYYIDISSESEEIIEKSIEEIVNSFKIAGKMGAKRVVVHMGSAKYITRRRGMEITKSTVLRIIDILKEENLWEIAFCPETMGKINEMGSLEEVLELCALDENLIPTIDFGHLNARTNGSLVSEEDFDAVIKKINKKLGNYRANNFHCHFSKVEFTKAGEKKHLTFSNEEYGPLFLPFAKVIKKRKITPVIICESQGTQDIDALSMKEGLM